MTRRPISSVTPCEAAMAVPNAYNTTPPSKNSGRVSWIKDHTWWIAVWLLMLIEQGVGLNEIILQTHVLPNAPLDHIMAMMMHVINDVIVLSARSKDCKASIREGLAMKRYGR